MGEKLAAFVREVLRQRELLEAAMDHDDVALSLMREDEIGRRNRPQGTGCRRVWTRRDKRLFDSRDDGSIGCPRTERILRRLRPERGEGPHGPLLREAFDEARREGTFSHLAPILESLADAHAGFFDHAAEMATGQLGAEMQFPYGRVRETFDAAVNRIKSLLPPGAVRFDMQYPWDGRHESPVLHRDLCLPADETKQGRQSPRVSREEADATLPRPGTKVPTSKSGTDDRMRGQVFISYSHKDKRWLDDLRTHLKPYLRDGSMTAWSDQQVATGSKWFSEIQAALARTSVAVLLVTPNFLASDFIHEHELVPILEEAKRGGVGIVWIPIEACAFEKTRLKDVRAVIPPDKPLAGMKKADRNRAWVGICEEIERVLKQK